MTTPPQASPDSLLDVARSLAEQSTGPKADAFSRRAVSTAYYAVFHLMLEELESELSKTTWGKWAPEIVRVVDHKKLLALAKAMDTDNKANIKAFKELKRLRLWEQALPGDENADVEMKQFARMVVALQTERENADYNRGTLFDESTAALNITMANDAIVMWRNKLRTRDIARVFLLALFELEGRRDEGQRKTPTGP